MTKPNPYEAPKTELPCLEPAERQRGWRWYHYALRRLPMSLLISLIIVLVGFPLLFLLFMLLLRLLVV